MTEEGLSLALERKTEKFTLKAWLSEDRMKLFVDVEPSTAGIIVRDEIKKILEDVVKPDLINIDVVEDIVKELRKGKKVEQRRVAKGFEAEKGIDGKVLLLVKKFSEQPEVKVDAKGFAKFGDLQFFDNIRKGQLVARIYPPKKGKDGRDATGATIPSAPGEPCKAEFDSKTLKVAVADKSTEYQTVSAEEDGYLEESGGKFSISSSLKIKGDVDYHTGNIDFVGAVNVAGGVHKGFSVRAVKGITIEGNVEEANISCSAGDIAIRGLLIGGAEAGSLVAAGDIAVGLAEKASLEARGRISIKKEAMFCTIRSGATVELPEGKLIGGHAFAVCGLEAKEIGNSAGQQTTVHLCSTIETTAEFATLEADIEGHEKALKMIGLHLGPFLRNPDRIMLIKEPLKSKMDALFKKHKVVDESRIKLLAKKKEMLETTTANNVMRVNFKKMLHAGVEIFAGEDTFKVLDSVEGPKSIDFNSEEKKFVLGEYKGLECEVNPPKPTTAKK